MKFLLLTAVFTALTFAQRSAESEQEDLRRAVTEGSTSATDLVRSLESHLVKYPATTHRPEIERALLKAAVETHDDRRIAQYGTRVLSRDAGDLPTLDRVTQSLIVLGGEENLKQALELSQRYEKLLGEVLAKPVESNADKARRQEDVARALSRAILSQSIATGGLGDAQQAAALARKSFAAFPNAEAASQLARQLAALGKLDDAVRAYADAFTVPDPNIDEAGRAAIRQRMGELYRKRKGGESGLGEIVLEAYDRNASAFASRKRALRELDPNSGLSNPMDFTLSGVKGDKLPLASLKGKAVVLDFWATWCGPCRAQHPLYEKVMERFASRDDVVFLFINTDEEREPVQPFLAQQGWKADRVYFEDGLSRTLKVNSIPMTLVIGRNGTVVSRMNGFDPERFVDMLSDRINEALN